MKKYYKSKNEAIEAAKKRNDPTIKAWKMPKGTRHAGQYAVCDELEYLNTY